jgi:UDP-N-acetylmuramoylalanine--D-glutamate ligase
MKTLNKNDKIAILGYGIEGKSSEKYLYKNNFKKVTILEKRKIKTKYFPLISGEKYLENLDQFDYIFKSPGIHPKKVTGTKTTISSQIEYIFTKHPLKKIIGITGTKGKGTCSSLITEIIKNSGKTCFLGGNIGFPPLDFIDTLKEEDYLVLELSSFQVMNLKKSPHLAIILMVTSDHLDYHQDLEEYLLAKQNLIINQKKSDYCIYNKDYKNTVKIVKPIKSKKIEYSLKTPQKDYAYLNKENYLCFKDEKIIHKSELSLIGDHNLENILPAINVAKILKIENKVIKKTLKNFQGLPHRLEKVREYKEIKFINDSFSTTPETCLAALKSFSQENIALLLGGSEKNSNYEELIKYLNKNKNTKIFCFGITGKKIKALTNNSEYIFDFTKSFNNAISYLKKKKNGVLLLSPASASFDQFKNYKERAKIFKDLSLKVKF